jgi:calcineurin-like phosphoesterase family protein
MFLLKYKVGKFMETWFISDTHFGHRNILSFKDEKGNLTRPGFSSVEEMDEFIIKKWNDTVYPKDRIYHLGDVVINRRYLKILERLQGRKVLIKGNHDLFKLKDYTPYFDDIRSYKMYPKHGIVCSHIPVHPAQLTNRFKANVHGHLHQNVIKNDKRYLNVCVEHTKYTPIHFEEVLKRLK